MISRQPLAPPPGVGLVLLLALGLALARSIVTFPIEHVDAAFKYLAAADMVRGGGLAEMLQNHHTMRWSQVLPQVVVTWATGFRYEGLYLLPLLVFGLTGALLWRGLQPVLSPMMQALLLALLFLEPVGLTHTGQLLNPPFGVAYALLAVSVLAQPGPPNWPRTVIAALAFFLAYGSHSTYLSFAAGGVAWLLLVARRPGMAALLVFVLALLLLAETQVFNAIAGAGLSGGRFESLATSEHLALVANRFEPVAALDLLTRWLRLPLFSLFAVLGFMSCVVWLALDGAARRAAPPFLQLCILVGGAYAVAVTFAVVSITPLRPIQPLRVMYLEPFLPFAIAASVYALAQAERHLPQQLRVALPVCIAAAMVLLLGIAATQKDRWDRILNNRLSAFVWQSHAQMSTFADRFERGEVILLGRTRYALEQLVRYRQPITVRRRNEAPALITTPLISPEVRCVRGLRRIPLGDNERPCSERVRAAALAAGARWQD